MVQEGGKRSAAVTTWKLTVNKIQEKNPASVQLLEVMSFLSPDDIPKEFLKGVPFLSKSDALFHTTLAPLLSFPMIYRLESSNCRLHRLVGLCVRTGVHSEDPGFQRRNVLQETVLPLLNNRFPKYDIRANHRGCMSLVPHAVAALGHITGDSQSIEAVLLLQENLGLILDESGDTTGAQM